MAKGKAGRPAHQPTDEQRRLVRSLAGFGIPQEDIAREIGISVPTLMKHYEADFYAGQTQANAKVVESLYKNATQNMNATAQVWWTKCRLGWKETMRHEGTNEDGSIGITFKTVIEKRGD